ncbi:MAG: cytidylate kinase-like family protein [Magnetococcales bacterium]|nr:cytidylate kinase-like family protein [Magnetococcales bacterium]
MKAEKNKLQSIIQATFFDIKPKTDKAKTVKPRPLVTVARDFGAEGEQVAQIMAKKLGVTCFDQQILDGIVNQVGVDPHLMQKLDERAPNKIEDWIVDIFSAGKGSREEFLKRLYLSMNGVAVSGGVVVGRGGQIILAKRQAFRIRVTGTPEICAKRVSTREEISLEAARKRVAKINKERYEFVKELFQMHPTDSSYYDLVISSDRLSPEQVADLALNAMKQMGFPV